MWLYLSGRQENGRCFEGNRLRKELGWRPPVFNANLLDYLLANHQLIPEEWKVKRVFFWGTIYRGVSGDLYIRCLYWDGGRWSWKARCLANHWGVTSPAAMLNK